MKHIFTGSLGVLCLLSAVAYLWQPRTEASRLDGIRAMLAEVPAETGGGWRCESIEAYWDTLTHHEPKGLSLPSFPPSVLPMHLNGVTGGDTLSARAMAAYLDGTRIPLRGYTELRQRCGDDNAGMVTIDRTIPAERIAAGRLGGLLVLDGLARAGVHSSTADAVRRRLAPPEGDVLAPWVSAPDGPPAEDAARCETLLAWIYEADLDDDFAVSREEFTGYLSRLDADGNGLIDDYDLPDRPLRLLWSSAPGAIRDRQIEGFNRRYPRHHLQLDAYVSSIDRTIVQALAGVGPDLFDVITPFQLAAFVGSGVAMDVTDAFAERGIDVDDIWPAVKPFYMMDGRIYGHPRNAGAPAMWFNKDMFDEAGIPYPTADWTWDEFVAIANQLTVRDAAGRPQRFGFISTWDHTGWFPNMLTRQWGAPMFNEAGTRCIIDSPEAAEALSFAQQLMYEDRVMPSPSDEAAMANAGGWGTGALTLFAGERGAMAIGYRWWLVVLRQPEFAHLRLGVVPMPATPSGTIEGGGGAVLVNKGTKNFDGAMLFMEYLHSTVYNDLNNDEADSLSPVRSYYYGDSADAYLHNPRFPNEDFHAVWRDVLAKAKPPSISPYVNGQLAERLVLKYTDFIKYPNEGRSVADVLDALAAEMNRAIVESLRQNPTLMRRYEQALANGAAPAWDRSEDGP